MIRIDARNNQQISPKIYGNRKGIPPAAAKECKIDKEKSKKNIEEQNDTKKILQANNTNKVWMITHTSKIFVD